MRVAEARAAASGAAGSGGQIYAALVTTRLAEEERRGSSLQARGLAVVTTSGTLVTLIFAIAQFVSGGKILARLPDASRWLLAIAAVAFVAAAVGGLVTNIPRLFARPRLKEIADQIESGWSGPAAVAEKTVARARVRQLKELESANDVAARAVLSGLAAEVLAIALAAAAAIVVIFVR
jgi:hypothetical protein